MLQEKNNREYTIEELIELTNTTDRHIYLLDVRLNLEREESRITIENAKARIIDKHIAIPRMTFQNEYDLHSYLTPHLTDFPSDDMIIVYCRAGSRSLSVTNILIDKMGFKETRVFSLQGGIEAWNK